MFIVCFLQSQRPLWRSSFRNIMPSTFSGFKRERLSLGVNPARLNNRSFWCMVLAGIMKTFRAEAESCKNFCLFSWRINFGCFIVLVRLSKWSSHCHVCVHRVCFFSSQRPSIFSEEMVFWFLVPSRLGRWTGFIELRDEPYGFYQISEIFARGFYVCLAISAVGWSLIRLMSVQHSIRT